jgi:hypothetical protein
LESMIASASGLTLSERATMLAAVEAVPEPTALTAVVLAAGLGFARKRRRNVA